MEEKIKLLVIEDEKKEYYKIKNILNPLNSFELFYGKSSKEIKNKDLVLIDLDLKIENPLKVYKETKKINKNAGVFFMGRKNKIDLDNRVLVSKPIYEKDLIDSILNIMLSEYLKVI